MKLATRRKPASRDGFSRSTEATELQAECERRKKAYKLAVLALFDRGYEVHDSEYKRLRAAVDNAVIDLEVAQLKLETSQRAANAKAGSRPS